MWNIAKSIIRPTSSLRMVTPLQGLQVQRLPRKDKMHTALGGTTLYSEKRQNKINIYSDFGPSWPKSSILQPIWGVGLNTPLLGYRQKVTISNR